MNEAQISIKGTLAIGILPTHNFEHTVCSVALAPSIGSGYNMRQNGTFREEK